MKKLLLSSAAVCGLAMIATPAAAQVQLELGGYFKGYGAFVDQDEYAGDVNDFDFIRDTELHFGGETTLDNGLTVGAHIEAETDNTSSGDDFQVDESYVYFSGGWGRVNFGAEDGAAYLLQVAAPSADSNIDGIRQYVQPINYGVEGNTVVSDAIAAGGLDYDQDITGKADKLTYLSPIVSGFQLGLTYAPDADEAADLEGIGTDNVEDQYGAAYEIALRYEGQFEGVGVIAGAGYGQREVEAVDAAGLLQAAAGPAITPAGTITDDTTAWNAGLDLDFGPIGFGVIYSEETTEVVGVAAVNATSDAVLSEVDQETLVIGVDYTTGPFKLGASYLNKDNTFGIEDLETERYSAGVVYTYGPGMTFRGSIGYVEHEAGSDIFGATDQDELESTYVTLGTQINF